MMVVETQSPGTWRVPLIAHHKEWRRSARERRERKDERAVEKWSKWIYIIQMYSTTVKCSGLPSALSPVFVVVQQKEQNDGNHEAANERPTGCWICSILYTTIHSTHIRDYRISQCKRTPFCRRMLNIAVKAGESLSSLSLALCSNVITLFGRSVRSSFIYIVLTCKTAVRSPKTAASSQAWPPERSHEHL